MQTSPLATKNGRVLRFTLWRPLRNTTFRDNDNGTITQRFFTDERMRLGWFGNGLEFRHLHVPGATSRWHSCVESQQHDRYQRAHQFRRTGRLRSRTCKLDPLVDRRGRPRRRAPASRSNQLNGALRPRRSVREGGDGDEFRSVCINSCNTAAHAARRARSHPSASTVRTPPRRTSAG